MSHLCAICRGLFRSTDEVFSTYCGHIFHSSCLTQWLKRSKTCPQCREATDASKIHRIYFNISSNDVVNIDAAVKREDFDCLDSRICRMEIKINAFTEQVECSEQFRIAAETSRSEADSLKIELKNVKKKLKVVLSDREKTRLLIEQLKKDLQKTTVENDELKNEMKQMKLAKTKKDLNTLKCLKKKDDSPEMATESSSESESKNFPYNLRNRVRNSVSSKKRKATHLCFKNVESGGVPTKISRPVGCGSSAVNEQLLETNGSEAGKKTIASINKPRAGRNNS